MYGRIYQINIKSKTGEERGIPKLPIDSVDITTDGVVGDYNKYRIEKKNADLNKALMLIPLETLAELQQEGWPVLPGHLGENVTTFGVPYDFFEIGGKYRLGVVQIEVTQPCTPCGNLKVLPYVGTEKKAEFVKTLLNRRGWYAKVLVEGKVRIGDSIERILE